MSSLPDYDLTVITPVLNGIEHIATCLDSTRRLEKSGLRIEHIVVDGGSQDGTLELLAGWPDLTLFERPGENAVAACNFGVERANGRFVTLLMADDVWVADAGMEFARAIATPSWSIALFAAERVERTTKSLLAAPHTLWRLLRGYPGLNSALIAIALAKDVRFEQDFPATNDGLWMIEALSRADRVLVGDFAAVSMCAHSRSRTLSPNRDVLALKYEINRLSARLMAMPFTGVSRSVLGLWALHSALTIWADGSLAFLRGESRLKPVQKSRPVFPSLVAMCSAAWGLLCVWSNADALFRGPQGEVVAVRRSELGFPRSREAGKS